MPTPDEFVRALRNERTYAGDHPILGRSPVTAPPVLGPVEAWRALGSPDPLNLGPTLHSATPQEAGENTLRGLMNILGPLPTKGAGVGLAAALPALVRYGTAAAEHAPAPFYSAAERAIGEAGLQKAPMAQWLATLRNKGIKEEELNWLGLGKAPVGDTPKWAGHVTKDELNDWIKSHGVQLQEVQKGGDKTYKDFNESYAAAPKFQQYQLPGGSNYRETLLTLPQRPRPDAQRLNEINKRLDEIVNMPVRQSNSRSYALQKEYDELMAEHDQLYSINPPIKPFTSSHWDEPNVLAHVRHNDRILPPLGGEIAPGATEGNPRKALFLEEVQSDWHQKGRKQGYAGPKPTPTERNEIDAIWKRSGFPNLTADNWGSGYQPQQIAQEANARGAMSDEDFNKIQAYGEKLSKSSNIPDAPFKQSWPDLALKRMLVKAAHEGYDALAWTPGDVQAARYDLSKQVSKLQYNPETGHLVATPKVEGDILDRTVPPDKLADAIGKDAADRILNNPTSKYEPMTRPGVYHELTGDDLKVGGEGMRAFYDKMLVDKANALGKRYGAKVQQEPLQPKKTFEDWTITGQDQDPFAMDEGQLAGLRKKWEAEPPQQAHVLPITPELRAAAQKGFPLFATGGVAALGAAQENASTQPQERSGTADENTRMLNALRGNNPGAL